MENRIDAALSDANRDQILDLIQQINALLPFQIDLTPEERKSLVKMGDAGRPLVDQTLLLAEQDDSFLPRSFEVTEMRQRSCTIICRPFLSNWCIFTKPCRTR